MYTNIKCLNASLFTFIDLPSFRREGLLNDDEYRELQQALLENPRMGIVISGTGGLRKLRWAPKGVGKSGALRVIYYNRSEQTGRIYMVFIFPKNVSSNLSNSQKQQLKQIIERLIE